MKTINIKTAGLFALGFSSVWFALRFSTFFKLFTPLSGEMLFSDTYVNQGFAVFMTFLCIACVAAMFYREQVVEIVHSSKYSPIFFGFGASAGFALINAFTLIEGASEVLLGVGVFLAATFICLLFLLLCVRLMQEPAMVAGSYFAICIFAVCIPLAISAFSNAFARVFAVVAPFIAGTCCAMLKSGVVSPEQKFGIAELRSMQGRLLVPIVLFISLSSLFNKLVMAADSALAATSSRLVTDVLTFVLFGIYIAYRQKVGSTSKSDMQFFILSVVVMMLGLLAIMVIPDQGPQVGGPILMTSFYCFVFLFMSVLIWDHVKTKAAPMILAGFFLIGSVIIPLLASNTFVYEWAAGMQGDGTLNSVTIASMLSFLAAVIVFVSLSSQIHNAAPQSETTDTPSKKLCEKVARDFGLSAREEEVLFLVYQRYSRKAIADALVLSPSTIQGHVDRIYKKLEVHKRDELIEFLDSYSEDAASK